MTRLLFSGLPEYGGVRHPRHDEIGATIRGWYETPDEHWYGFRSAESPSRDRIILRVDEPDQVAPALAAAGGTALTIRVEGRDRAAMLDSALLAAGCTRMAATTHLALVGSMAPAPEPAGLLVETIGAESLAEWAAVKLQAFADSEAAPDQGRLAQEIAKRRSELSFADFRIGRVDGEAAAVMAFFRGPDQMVFNLGTRVPYRRRGIARAMLAHWVTDRSCRSFVINADDGGRAADLYRRLGFVDEVYWYQRYELDIARP
jgi:GNAT superfamily N-acetyltransferase